MRWILAFFLVFGSCSSLPEGVEPYPFDYCLIMDQDLGSMGDEVSVIHDGRQLKFCCEPCIDEFNEDPKKWMNKLDSAIAKKRK